MESEKKLFTIGICDDEETFRRQIKTECEEHFREASQKCRILEFASAEEVLAYGQRNPDTVHLLFLDIEMGGLNGIELLRKIEDTEWIRRVVFASSHTEMALDAFGIKTLKFLRKPIQTEEMTACINIAMRENAENIMLEYLVGSEKQYIALEDIYSLKAERNYTYLCLKNDRILINENLKYWQKVTSQMPIIRIHKAYLVNLMHVKKWETTQIILDNQETLALGRQYAKEAKEMYLTYIRKMAEGRR